MVTITWCLPLDNKVDCLSGRTGRLWINSFGAFCLVLCFVFSLSVLFWIFVVLFYLVGFCCC